MRAGVRLLIAAGALALLFAPASAHATVTCSLSGATLQVTSPEFGDAMRVGRVGDQITVVAYNYSEVPFEDTSKPVPTTCAGPMPTVHNVDSIHAAGTAEENAKLIVDLTGGLFVPGATPEDDGSAEIELTLSHVARVVVRGGEASEHLALGVIGPSAAINLNADEATPDADLLAAGRKSGRRFRAPTFLIATAGGDDVVTANGGTPFTDHAPGDIAIIGQDGDDRIVGGDRGGGLVGGAGADLVVGGAKPEFIGGGKGEGRDTLISGGGDDLIFGQGGRDLIVSGPGRDAVISGLGRDRVRCGPDRDFLEITTGRKDRRKGCEHLTVFNLD